MLGRPFDSRDPVGWTPIPSSEVSAWDEKLLHTASSYHQYPFWTEPYRRLGIRPTFLLHVGEQASDAYVCVQSVGMPGLRLGIIVNGPVNLHSNAPVDGHILEELVVWARRSGYILLKFSHADPECLHRLVTSLGAKTVDAFPFFGNLGERLVVDLLDDEKAMLASFEREARQDIKKALCAEYEIRSSDSAEDLATIWPMIERLSRRKGIRMYRPVAGWQDLLARASRHQCARIYMASLDSEIVQAILVVRDARIAQTMLSVLDVDTLRGRQSPGCLLHWQAMRDMRRLGCLAYDLGPPSGPVFMFKRKFHPAHAIPPHPVVVATRPALYFLWSRAVLRTILLAWPRLRSALSRLLQWASPRAVVPD